MRITLCLPLWVEFTRRREGVNVLYTTVMILVTELIIGLVGAVLFEIASRKDEDDTHNQT